MNFFNSLSKICSIDLYHLNPCEAYWADSDGLKLRNELFERDKRMKFRFRAVLIEIMGL